MKEVLDVLAALGEIEWARAVGGDEPLRPPFIAWRFRSVDEQREIRIAKAVQSHAGATAWIISKGDRNWVIEPAAFAEFARNFRVDVEASRRFAADFPAQTRTALADATALAAHLRRMLVPQ